MSIFRSIRFKMLSVFLLFYLFISVPLVIMNGYAINVVRKQVALSNKNMASLYMHLIDNTLFQINTYFYNLAATNSDVMFMDLPMDQYEQRYQSAKIRLYNLINEDLLYYSDKIDSIFIYSSINDDLLMSHTSEYLYDEVKKIKRYASDMLRSSTFDINYRAFWFIEKIDSHWTVQSCKIYRQHTNKRVFAHIEQKHLNM